MRTLHRATNAATREAAQAQAASHAAIGDMLATADDVLEESQRAGGQTAAIMAQTQMIRTQAGIDAARSAADGANAAAILRMREEQRAEAIFARQLTDRLYSRTPGETIARRTGRSLFQ
jgi:hypothetical protein